MKLSGPFILVLGLAVLLSAGAGYGLRAATEPDNERGASSSPEATAVTAVEPTLRPEASAAPPEPSPSVPPSPTATTLPEASESNDGGQNFEITVVSVFEQDPAYTVDVEYPQFGLPFDEKISAVIDAAVGEIKGLAKTNPPGGAIPGPYAIDVGFEAVYLSPEIVSIRLQMYTYTGGAHGNGLVYGFNFDPSTGAELSVDDALALVGLTLDEVADRVRTELAARLDNAFFADGALPVEENYETFLVDGSQVTFVFQQYQVAPYAAGHQEVSLPRAGQ